MGEEAIHRVCTMTGCSFEIGKVALELSNQDITKALAYIRTNPSIVANGETCIVAEDVWYRHNRYRTV